MSAPFTIRAACIHDVGAIQELRSAIRAEGLYFYPDDGSGSGFTLDSRFGCLTLIAEHERGPAGWLEFLNGESPSNAHCGRVVVGVAKRYRGSGVGSALFESLHQWAARQPLIERIELRCYASNAAAIRLYEALGYIREGRLTNAVKLPDGTYRDILLLARPAITQHRNQLPDAG